MMMVIKILRVLHLLPLPYSLSGMAAAAVDTSASRFHRIAGILRAAEFL